MCNYSTEDLSKSSKLGYFLDLGLSDLMCHFIIFANKIEEFGEDLYNCNLYNLYNADL